MRLKFFGKTITIRAETSPMPPMSADAAWQQYLSGNGFSGSAIEALQISAVFRCVDLLAKTMASLPLHMMQSDANGKRHAAEHRLYNMVRILPNEYTTAYDFWHMFVCNLLLTDGAYAKIKRDARGYITSIWNIPTRSATAYQNTENGERYIVVSADDGAETLHRGEYIYVPNMRFSSDKNSESPLFMAAKILGIANDLNNMSASAFESGVNPGGFVEIPSGLSDRAYERLQKDFASKYAGVRNAGKFILLEEGAKAQLFTRDLEKTQALEARKFAVEEICRFFGVPLHLCMSLEHATFSNIEQQSLEFVRDAINPMSVRIEQALYRDLLTANERKQYYFKFNTNGLLRGDTAARTAYYNAMRQNGIMSANEIRALEDMNPIGAEGDTVYINGNMLPLKYARRKEDT